MAKFDLGICQGVVKENFCGNIRMNRYGIFNGLERPRRIDASHRLTLLGYDPPTSACSCIPVFDTGRMTAGSWYSYRYIALNWRFRRPVPVADETDAFTRGNPGPVSSAIMLGPQDQACSVMMNGLPWPAPDWYPHDVTHLGLYRSFASPSSTQAEIGPWFLTMVCSNQTGAGSPVTVVDVKHDTELGEEVEIDNFPPNAYRCAIEIDDEIYMGGRREVGEGLTCRVTFGSPLVILETAGRRFYDGIRGWKFCLLEDDNVGGVDGIGNYYVSYVRPAVGITSTTHLRLEDEFGNQIPYGGRLSGGGRKFVAWIDGNLLRWCKKGEPESCRPQDSALTQGDITGLAQIPNQPMLVVVTDKPTVHIYDTTIIGSPRFKIPLLISNEFMAWQPSLCPVEGRLRGIDPAKGCIWECDGAAVRDITRGVLQDIWKYLSTDITNQVNWHAVYDANQKIYGAFVTLANSGRLVDFAILQNVRTGRWFFAWPKDMLCTCPYFDPHTGQRMVLGGTQGLGTSGGTWGRIWTPDHYNDWIYPNSLLSGTIVAGAANNITVDVTGGVFLQTVGDGLKGRWVMVTDANGENEQVASISSNTAANMTIDRVYGGGNPALFFPIPAAGWKFYVGLIECRWGPKSFTFADPSILKRVLDIYLRMDDADAANPPFIRLYKGLAHEYERQIGLSRVPYIDGTPTEGWRNLKDNIEPCLEWGFALVERSYKGIEIKDISLVFNPLDQGRGK